MRVVFVIDPPNRLDAASDSTIELMRCFARREVEVSYALRESLRLENGQLMIVAQQVELFDDDEAWFSPTRRTVAPILNFNLIYLRLEPPVDSNYRHICQLLEMAQHAGVPVTNNPSSILMSEEKLSTQYYPQLCPRTLVSLESKALQEFAAQLPGGCVIKTLGRMGGQGVYSFGDQDSNVAVCIDDALGAGKMVLVQERLPEIANGDRRVFIIGGKPYDIMVNRIPRYGSHLGNMSAGGSATAVLLGDEERAIGETIGANLVAAGILFAGIDVIGGKLIEINITCPTGLRVVRDQTGECPADAIFDALLSHLVPQA